MFSCRSTSCTSVYLSYLTIHTPVTTEVSCHSCSGDILHFAFSDVFRLGSHLAGAISMRCVLLNALAYAFSFQTCVVSRLPGPCNSCSSSSKDIPVPQPNPKSMGVTGAWAFLANAMTNGNIHLHTLKAFQPWGHHLDDADHNIWSCLSLVCLVSWWPCWFYTTCIHSCLCYLPQQ